jgi:hypothetical protein
LTAPIDSIDGRGETVEAFLQKPLDRRCFDAFFRECLRQTVYCLNSLRVRGYHLPSSGEGNSGSLRDLAYGVLGSLLRTERGKRPFHIVLDYFDSKGIARERATSTEKLSDLLTGLLWSFTRQELFRINSEEDPQKAKLKRRLGDVLKGGDYGSDNPPGSAIKYIYLAANQDNQRIDCPMVSYDVLQRIVENAYLDTCNLSQCSMAVFAELDRMGNVQNRLRKHEFVTAAVSVVLRYLETEESRTARLSTPEGDWDVESMTQARQAAVAWLRESVISDFIEKGRITNDTGGRFALAADQYLLDLSAHGNTDPIPQYFREVMPECEHGKYLETYKYVFETIINNAVEDFRRRLRE